MNRSLIQKCPVGVGVPGFPTPTGALQIWRR